MPTLDFNEFLQEEGGVVDTSVTKPQTTSRPTLDFNEFSSGATSLPVTQPDRGPGLLKQIGLSVVKPAIELGKDILSQGKDVQGFRASRRQSEEIARRIQEADIDPNQKQLIANQLSAEQEKVQAFQDFIPEKNAKQVLGDVLGTALLALPVPKVLSGIRAGRLATAALTGAEIGAAFGGAEALSEDEDLGGFLKEILIGAAIGAPLGLGGSAAIKGTQAITRATFNRTKPLLQSAFEKSRKLMPDFFKSVGSRISQNYGDEGVQIMNLLNRADNVALRTAGGDLAAYTKGGLFELPDESLIKLVGAWEGRIPQTALGEAELKAFNAFDAIRNDISEDAIRKGVKVALRRGDKIPFKAKENFFPHMAPAPEKLAKGSLREDVLENAVRIGAFKSEDDAAKVLDSYLEFVSNEGRRGGKFWVQHLLDSGQAETADQARGMTTRFFKPSRIQRAGSLEKAREFNFPFYDADPRRVLPTYSASSRTRLAEIGQFGESFEKVDSLIGKIVRSQGTDTGREIRQLVNVARGAVESAPKAMKVSLFLRTLQIPKLAFAQVANAGQSLNTLLASDAPTTLRAVRMAFTDAGKLRALKTGATLESVLRESQKTLGTGGDFARNFLRFSGFTATEQFNRVTAANAGIIYAEKQLQKAIKNPSKTIFRERLQELGVDASEAIKRGSLTQNELLTAGKRLADISQFRGRGVDLPKFSASPVGKLAFQFKSFAFNQTKFLKDRLVKQTTAGNYGGVARDLIVLGTVFPMTGEVIADIRSLLTNTKRPTDALDRYIQNFLQVGGFGILGDSIQSAKIGKLAENVLGPTGGTAIDIMQRAVQGVSKGKITDNDMKFLINQTGFGRVVSNIAFPNDKKEQETFLQTLIDEFEE